MIGVGIHPGLSRERYESIDAINVSRLAGFEGTPAHAREAILNPTQPTKAMIFGTQFHCALLEPERFEADYIAAPDFGDLRTTKAKEAKRDFQLRHPTFTADNMIEPEDYTSILGMVRNVWGNPDCANLLRGGLNEVSLVFVEPETGLLCKSRLDHLGEFDGYTWIVDAKSIEDASDRKLSTSIKSLNYGARLAFYYEGCNIASLRPRRAAWVVAEKNPPYLTRAIEADQSALAKGWSKAKRWLRLYKECKESGVWPAYPPGIQVFTEEETEW